MIFRGELIRTKGNIPGKWGCCNSPRASSAAAEAEQGSRSSAGAGSAEAGSLGAPVGSGRTSIHRDGSTIAADVGTTAACRVGGECATVQRSRSPNNIHPAALKEAISK